MCLSRTGMAIVLLTAAVVGALGNLEVSASRLDAAPGKKVCTIKKVHGKKKRVCKTVKAHPTPTPVATPERTLFGQPSGIAIDQHDDVYVADAARHHILELSPDGQLLATIGGPGKEVGQFNEPWGLAFDGAGNLYVSEASGYHYPGIDPQPRRVQKFSAAGSPLTEYTQSSTLHLILPCGLAVDSAGNLYVSDYGGGQIAKISPIGQHLASIATVDPAPCGMAIDSHDTLYVSQAYTEDIGVYGADGRRVRVIGSRDGVDPPFGIAVDTRDNLYAVNLAGQCVKKWAPDGRLLATWGKAGSEPGQFAFDEQQMLGIAVDHQGNVYVSDAGNDRVQKLSSTGQVLAIWK